jgi:hypothetical protein
MVYAAPVVAGIRVLFSVVSIFYKGVGAARRSFACSATSLSARSFVSVMKKPLCNYNDMLYFTWLLLAGFGNNTGFLVRFTR